MTLSAGTRLVVNQGQLEVNAGSARGGNLLVTGADLIFHGGGLLASSGRSFIGGNVVLRSTDQVQLLGTRVAASGGGNGGSITIDPVLALLDRAALNADGGVNGGNIAIHSGTLLNSETSLMFTGKTGIAGSISLTPPDISLAGSLVSLPASLALPGATLANQCGKDLNATDVSSFLVAGKGGTPPDPAGWQPDPAQIPSRPPRD